VSRSFAVPGPLATLLILQVAAVAPLDAQRRGGPFLGIGVQGHAIDAPDVSPNAAGGVGVHVLAGWDVSPWLGVALQIDMQGWGLPFRLDEDREGTRQVWAGPVVHVYPGGGPVVAYGGIGHMETSVLRFDDPPTGPNEPGLPGEDVLERGAATLLGVGVDVSLADRVAVTPFAAWTHSDFADVLTVGVRVKGFSGFE
jgi:hypothetical protein